MQYEQKDILKSVIRHINGLQNSISGNYDSPEMILQETRQSIMLDYLECLNETDEDFAFEFISEVKKK